MTAPRYEIDGLLIVDKPSGWTSHDVIARMRRLTGIRRIGHAGTLDPLATGVLPLGIGQGTRVLEYITEAEKAYTATVRLGVSTDTYDADGTAIATADWSPISPEDVQRVLASFVGEIEQQPPVYSAIKQGGVALHRLARAGHQVEAPVRTVSIYALELLAVDLPYLTFEVRCSKGTYVRSLAHDLGQQLGCGAHLSALRRTATGGFTLSQALTLEQWEAALADGSWPGHVLPLDAPLLHLPAAILGAEAAARLRDGVAPPLQTMHRRAGALCRAYDADGRLVGILQRSAADTAWRTEKVFQRHPAATKKRGDS